MNSSANRSVLTNASIGSIVDTLSAMNQVERAGLYVGLIRFLGIMWADIMRAITIAENNDDMEALLQTRVHRKRPPARKREMPEMMQNLEHTEDATGFMQVLSKTTAVTFFGSRMAMLQAHLESMETRQAARISRMLQARLQLWRNRWTMGMRSVSRDRVERFCAVLTAYEIEGDDSMAEGDDADWADKQWKYLEEHLAIDAVLLATGGQCHVVDNETLPHTQAEQATGSAGHTMVQRAPGLPWERATAREEAELRAHEEDERQERELQREHDEAVWKKHQEQKEAEEIARASQQWDDWAMRAEMAQQTRMRPVKRFKLEISVLDRDRNELATTMLEGDTEMDDSPQVTFGLHTEVVHHDAGEEQVEGEEEAQRDNKAMDKDNPSEAETEPTAMIAPPLTADLENLDDVLTSTMCREWFQWRSEGKVDNNMVEAKFGKRVLETFEINRAMIEMDEASQIDKEMLQGSCAAEMEAERGTGAGVGGSSASGDSNAGFSDANLAAGGTGAEGNADDGEGVGWPGPEGDGKVRQWHFPGSEGTTETRQVEGTSRAEEDEINAENTDAVASAALAGASTNDEQEQVLVDTQLDALLGSEMDVADDESRPAGNTTEGGSNSSDRGRSRQRDLSHWLL